MTVPRLTANFNSGEGDVRIPPSFYDLSPLMQCDLLKDWVGLLDKEYWEARKRWRAELVAARKLQDAP